MLFRSDCVELRHHAAHRKSIEAVWYTGKLMGSVLAQTLTDTPQAYVQGIWFNSAKFFDVEYQIYGEVPVPMPPNYASIYWEHASGNKSLRLVYDASSGAIKGFNVMGIRYRQVACQQWISTQTHIEKVLEDLGAANFDPEFFSEYEADLVRKYNQISGKNIVLKKKRGLQGLRELLGV